MGHYPLISKMLLFPNTSRVARKPFFGVSEQVRSKPDCTVTEADQRLEITDLGSIGSANYLYSEIKGADQLRGHRATDLRLCFRIFKK